jgi:hypothetical protein
MFTGSVNLDSLTSQTMKNESNDYKQPCVPISNISDYNTEIKYNNVTIHSNNPNLIVENNTNVKELNIDNLSKYSNMKNDIKRVCEYENQELFKQLEESVISNNSLLSFDTVFDNIPKDFKICDKSHHKSYDDIKYQLILNVVDRIKRFENASDKYRKTYTDYYQISHVYHCQPDHSIATIVHDINTNIKSIDQAMNSSIIVNHMKNHPEISSNDKTHFALMQLLITPTKIQNDMLTYELMYHTPHKKILFTCDNHIETMEIIRREIDRFIPLIQNFVDSKQWTVHNKKTLNFSPPKNRVLFVNTVDLEMFENTMLSNQLKLLEIYIQRNYSIRCIKWILQKDSKYDICWVFIVIGYIMK